MAKLIVLLQLDNSLRYENHKNTSILKDDQKSIHESLRTDYKKNYTSGTLEGFPKGIRLNSTLSGPRIIKIKQ